MLDYDLSKDKADYENSAIFKYYSKYRPHLLEIGQLAYQDLAENGQKQHVEIDLEFLASLISIGLESDHIWLGILRKVDSWLSDKTLSNFSIDTARYMVYVHSESKYVFKISH